MKFPPRVPPRSIPTLTQMVELSEADLPVPKLLPEDTLNEAQHRFLHLVVAHVANYVAPALQQQATEALMSAYAESLEQPKVGTEA